MNSSINTVCPECGSIEFTQDEQRAELVCNCCGLVVESNLMDEGPEWRAFDNEQMAKRARTGAPMTNRKHDGGLTTDIDFRNVDSHGRAISSDKRSQWYRLRKWQNRIRVSNGIERNLAIALSELDRKSSNLSLPKSVREEASVIYRSAVKQDLIRGRSIDSVVSSSIYAACRRAKVPRSLEEIAEVSNASKKEIGRTYRFLNRQLNLKVAPSSPADYIPRFASALNLSGAVESKSIEIVNQFQNTGLTSGKAPTAIAAATLYIGATLLGERKTQSEIARVAGITEVTLRNRYKEISESLAVGVI